MQFDHRFRKTPSTQKLMQEKVRRNQGNSKAFADEQSTNESSTFHALEKMVQAVRIRKFF